MAIPVHRAHKRPLLFRHCSSSMLWQGRKCFNWLMVVVVVENLHCPRHSSLTTCRNPKFAACFRSTSILPAFLVRDVLGSVVAVLATFGTNPCSFDRSGTVNTDCISMQKSVLLENSLDSIKVLIVTITKCRRWPKWAMFCGGRHDIWE